MSSDARPAAYLRRSYVDAKSPGDISREAQRTVVHKLAAADGHNGDLLEYDDWGVSADVAKSAKRTAYTRLLADMEAGRVSAVYAFDLDRLYRDPRDLFRIQEAARGHNVRIVTPAGELAIGDGADPSAEAFAIIGAVFGGMELKKIKKRNRAARDTRIARGDRLGRAPYGYQQIREPGGRIVHVRDPQQPIEPVIEAFRQAGSFGGAARLLNEQGVRAPRGRSWSGNVVAKIVRRDAAGELAGRRIERRVRVRGSHTLSRLLRCTCGQIMTPRRTNHETKYGQYGYVSYQCFRGRYEPGHPRPYMVSEKVLLPWVKDEISRLRPPADLVEIAAADDARVHQLEQRQVRVLDNYEDGLIDKASRNEKLAAISAEMERLEVRGVIETWPEPIDWNWPPEALNTALSVIFDHIQLDASLRPISAEWRVPELRADGAGEHPPATVPDGAEASAARQLRSVPD